MNIFVLDNDPAVAARMYCDRHIVKAQLEIAQMMSTAWPVLDQTPGGPVYRPTHANHPCTVWVRTCAANWEWAVAHATALEAEHRWRWRHGAGWEHKSMKLIRGMGTPTLPGGPRTPFAVCTGGVGSPDDPVAAYRLYYRTRKDGIAAWTRRMPPAWWFPGLKTQAPA